jgi:protein PhnA
MCPTCAHEWAEGTEDLASEDDETIKDAYGSILAVGDMVTLVKDLNVKGASSVLKVGTKVKIGKLVSGDHNIDCRVDGIGAMKLKSEFVKKA